jgi:hypothetical protein
MKYAAGNSITGQAVNLTIPFAMSPVFAEAFAKGNIKCCMARQVIWPIPVKKARAVANIPET